jgi:tRNA dimethylallyltransferase
MARPHYTCGLFFYRHFATLEHMSKPKIIAIVGPTASGKTSLSIEIAKQFNGEVISADSRQVYTGMDLGTGKVTEEEMAGIPHHLLDVAQPMEIYTGIDFKRDATIALNKIMKNEHLPIIAGGTFFYLELLRGNMQAAPVEPNPAFRQTLEQYSNAELLDKLREKDARRADSIDPDNRRRLERSLEIIHTLGAVPEVKPVESEYDWLLLGVDIPKETLHKNINTRLEQRLEQGMIEEVQHLLDNGITPQRLDDLGLEYRYILKYIQQEISYPEMCELIETKSRQFAKRQLTWLKRYPEIHWVHPKQTEEVFDQVNTFIAQ